MIIQIVKILLRMIGFFKREKFKYSQEYEDNYEYMGTGEKIWWVYKFFIRQIERAEKGKNIESYFKIQDFNFETEGFIKKESIILTAGGDLLTSVHINPENTAHLWDDIRDFFFNADIIYANLESPIVPDKKTDYVKNVFKTSSFNTTPKMFNRYVDNGRGINFFSTANNHSLDQGEQGLGSTIDYLAENGYSFTGTARTKEEQMDIPIVRKNNMNVAFLSYTYAVNGKSLPQGKEYMVNYIRLNKPDTDISLIREHIKIARQKGADIIVACLHWSLEFESYPIENVINMGHQIMECGIDIIIGNHAHVMQTMEWYKYIDPFIKIEKQGFIVYALGDLVSCQENVKNSKLANIVRLEISKGMLDNKLVTIVSGVSIKPVYLHSRMVGKVCEDFRVLDFIKLTKQIESGLNLHRLERKDVKEIFRLKDLLYRILPEKHESLLK
jgi:Putative enzyme of poly-gamma-glutamate biosynthesis (capsule formation)